MIKQGTKTHAIYKWRIVFCTLREYPEAGTKQFMGSPGSGDVNRCDRDGPTWRDVVVASTADARPPVTMDVAAHMDVT